MRRTPAAKQGQARVLHWLRLQAQPAQRFLHSLGQQQYFSHICVCTSQDSTEASHLSGRTIPFLAHEQCSGVQGRPG